MQVRFVLSACQTWNEDTTEIRTGLNIVVTKSPHARAADDRQVGFLAFRTAEITVTQPVAFLQLVWATLLAFYAFGEEPNIWTWIGGGIIVASATYIAYREARRKDRAEPKFEQT